MARADDGISIDYILKAKEIFDNHTIPNPRYIRIKEEQYNKLLKEYFKREKKLQLEK